MILRLLRLALLAFSLVAGTTLQAEAPPALSIYGGLPGIEGMAISPSGKLIATVARMNGQRSLVVMDASHELRASSPIGDAKVRSVSWAGEEAVIAIASATQNLGYGFAASKYEFYSAIVVPMDGSPARRVFDSTNRIAHAVFGSYGTRLVAGRQVAYFGGIELRQTADRLDYVFDGDRRALYAIDLKTDKARRVSPAPTNDAAFRRWLVDGEGKVGAILEMSSGTGNWQISNAQGKTLASGVDPTGDVSLISFGYDGSTVIYAREDDKAGETRWFEVPLAGGTAKEILGGIGIQRTYIDPSNGRLLGYLPRETTPVAVLSDPAKQAAFRKVHKAFPNLDVSISEFTPDLHYFLVHTSGNGDSGTWFLVDLQARRADPVGYDFPLIGSDEVGPVSTIEYHAADGLDLDGILTLPPGRTPKSLPLVVMPHGGPHSYDQAQFYWWAQAFASRGYAVFQPNFRGSTNRDDAFRRAGYGQWGRKMQTDISDGLAELARRGVIDPKRACIAGASYGGYAALAGVTLQRGLYRCAVAVAPVSDLDDMYWTDMRESGDNRMVKLSLDESLGPRAGFSAVSPRRHAAQADAPIMLIHGKDDTVVPLKQSTAMADALKDAKKPYELVIMPGEDHWLSRATTRQQMLEAAMRFVTQHNPAN